MKVLEGIIEKDIPLEQQQARDHQHRCENRNAGLNSVFHSLYILWFDNIILTKGPLTSFFRAFNHTSTADQTQSTYENHKALYKACTLGLSKIICPTHWICLSKTWLITLNGFLRKNSTLQLQLSPALLTFLRFSKHLSHVSASV